MSSLDIEKESEYRILCCESQKVSSKNCFHERYIFMSPEFPIKMLTNAAGIKV